jgi:two-component system, chemotaxis family, response regulator Rcp1
MSAKCCQILLVEDDPRDALLVMNGLEGLPGYTLRAVEDAVQALSYLRGDYQHLEDPLPQLILLDLNLPRMSGHEFLARIKADADLCHIPVVVYSNSALSEDVRKSYALHANCYIQKPATPREFQALVQQIVDFWCKTVQLA